jgi:hypothetical protein
MVEHAKNIADAENETKTIKTKFHINQIIIRKNMMHNAY